MKWWRAEQNGTEQCMRRRVEEREIRPACELAASQGWAGPARQGGAGLPEKREDYVEFGTAKEARTVASI